MCTVHPLLRSIPHHTSFVVAIPPNIQRPAPRIHPRYSPSKQPADKRTVLFDFDFVVLKLSSITCSEVLDTTLIKDAARAGLYHPTDDECVGGQLERDAESREEESKNRMRTWN